MVQLFQVYSQHVAVIVFLFFLVVMTIIIMNLLVRNNSVQL